MRSRSKTRFGAVEDIDKIIELKEDLPNFVREVIDPNTGRSLRLNLSDYQVSLSYRY